MRKKIKIRLIRDCDGYSGTTPQEYFKFPAGTVLEANSWSRDGHYYNCPGKITIFTEECERVD